MVAKWLERLAVNAKGLGSIPASSDTVESEGRQMKQCLITYNNSPLKKICWFYFVLATACAVYASKVLPHAPHTLAKTSFLHDFASVCGAYASNLLPYAPHMLATCYRMRRVR